MPMFARFASDCAAAYAPLEYCGQSSASPLPPSHSDVIMQPGSKTMNPPMKNAMICHIAEGELRVEQEGKTFTAKKNFVWTCNKDTKEDSSNVSNAVAIMRITDLMA